MNLFKKVSPSTRFMIKETARVCICLAGTITVKKLVIAGVNKVCGV